MARPHRGGCAPLQPAAAAGLLLLLAAIQLAAPVAAARALTQAGGGATTNAGGAANSAANPFASIETEGAALQLTTQAPATNGSENFGLAPGVGAPGGEARGSCRSHKLAPSAPRPVNFLPPPHPPQASRGCASPASRLWHMKTSPSRRMRLSSWGAASVSSAPHFRCAAARKPVARLYSRRPGPTASAAGCCSPQLTRIALTIGSALTPCALQSNYVGVSSDLLQQGQACGRCITIQVRSRVCRAGLRGACTWARQPARSRCAAPPPACHCACTASALACSATT